MVNVRLEYNKDIIRDWTAEVWRVNEIAKGNTPENYPNLFKKGRPFENVLPDLPSRVQRFNEASFMLACYGLAFLPCALTGGNQIKERASAKPDSLFDAWRRSVHRNRDQLYFSGFEACLDECLRNSGEEAAIAAFPSNSPARIMIDTLAYLRLEHKLISRETLTALLEKIDRNQKAQKPALSNPSGTALILP